MSENIGENITRRLAEHAATLRYADMPPAVIERAKLFLADFRRHRRTRRHDADFTPSMIAAAEVLGDSRSDGAGATIFSTRGRFAPPIAALVNGAIGHSMDFDPMNTPASLAPSPSAIPAALAAAEMCGAGGRDILTAIVAGYDVTCKVSQALGPAALYERGFHPTAVAGCFGATAAAGRVLGLSVEQMMHAFGIALSEAAGSMQYLRNGAWTKRFQAGNAGRNGLVAATFAKHGFTGAIDPLEGRFGLFHAYVPDAQPEQGGGGSARDLGDRHDRHQALSGLPPVACAGRPRGCLLRRSTATAATTSPRSWSVSATPGMVLTGVAGGAQARIPRASSTASSPPISPSPSCCGRAS